MKPFLITYYDQIVSIFLMDGASYKALNEILRPKKYLALTLMK